MNYNGNTFDEIIKEAKTGITNSNAYLPLLFDTKEMRYAKLNVVTTIEKHYPNLYEPTMIILDRKKLDETLLEYIKKSFVFYEHDMELAEAKNPIKSLFYHTLANTLLSEFDDIRSLFTRQIEFMKNERLADYMVPKNVGYVDLLCGNLVIGIAKENASSTSPLSIHISIERIINDKLYYYDFPCVRYGIVGSVAYIFDIQKVEERKMKEDYVKDKEYIAEVESYQLSVKNILKKAIKTKEIHDEEVIALLCSLVLMNERGIRDIIVPTVLVNRYNGLQICCYQNIALLNKAYEEASIKGETVILDGILAKISVLKHTVQTQEELLEERSISLIKNFTYLEEMCSDYKIFDYPMTKDTCLHFNIIPNGGTCKNALLKDVMNCIHFYEERERSLKASHSQD